jgi:hypothetical protein
MPVKVIVFSRDRALQLEAVLHSFYLHCSDADSADIYVLYMATSKRHKIQYQSLTLIYPKVNFVPQKSFRRDLLSIMNPYEKNDQRQRVYFMLCTISNVGFVAGTRIRRIWERTIGHFQAQLIQNLFPSFDDDSYILFLVDDNIFIRDFQLSDSVTALDGHPELLGCSLRLGENTVFCYPHNRSQKLPTFIDLDKMLVMYDWTRSEHDFGYPLEVSSSIYRLKDVLPFLMRLRFNNPNKLEDQMSSYLSLFRSKYPFLCCYQHSVTFCNPVNKVQTVIPNRAGEQYKYEVEELTERFDRDERIKVDAYRDFTPNGCHQEVELIFEKRSDE